MTPPPVRPGAPRDTAQARLPDGRIFEAAPGTPLGAVLAAARLDGSPPALAAVLRGKLVELTRPLSEDGDVRPVTLADIDGMRIYRRSLVLLLTAAAAELFPGADVAVEHSAASGGYYCEALGRPPFSPAELAQIAARMQAIVAQDEPFTRLEMRVAEAARLFRERGQEDTARLLAHRAEERVWLYRLRGRLDYVHGYVVPSTGCLAQFALHPLPSGFILHLPRQEKPDQLPPISPYPRLFQVFEEAGHWLDRLGLRSAGALNDDITAQRLPEISLVSEALHEARLAAIASEIVQQRERVRVVLVAGPSASGKTTFARRLAVQLLAGGRRPFPLSLDDYFIDRDLTPRDASGQPDFESLTAVDVARFNQDLLALMAGATVRLPRYNFRTGRREAGAEVTLGPGSVIIVEGIHGLNPALVPDLPAESVYRIYVSALTQLNLDRHNRVSTTDTRLLRRVVRDAAHRGYTASDTLRRWPSVARGERLHIFPYQEHGDAIFNSALAHEVAILRPLAEPLLLQVRPDTAEYLEANRLLSFLKWFRPAGAEVVPSNSILQEFISPSSIFERLDFQKFASR